MKSNTYLQTLQQYATKHLSDKQLHNIRHLPLYGPNGLRRWIAERDITAFIYLYFPHEFTLPLAPIHYQMLQDMQDIRDRQVAGRPGLKLARAIPRNHSKSTYYSRVLPLHSFLYGWSKLTVLLANNDDSARRLVGNIKTAIESNALINEDFPGIKGDTWGLERLTNIAGDVITAYGVGSGAVRGISTGMYRPSLVILDDIDDDKSVRSAIELSHHVEWLDKSVLQLGDNIQYTTSFIVVGTIIRNTSLMRYILNSPSFHQVIEKAVISFAINEYLWQQWRDNILTLARDNMQPKDASEDIFYQDHREDMLAGTKVLWDRPDAYRQAMLFKLHNEKAFQSELQNDPQDVTGALGSITKIGSLPDDIGDYHLLGALDSTIKGGKTNDLSAWVEVHFNPRTRDIIVSYVDAKQRNYSDTINDISGRIINNPQRYQGIFIETNSAGAIIAEEIDKRIHHRIYNVTGIHSSLPKIERISLLSQYLATGQLKFLDTLDEEIFTELNEFPFGRNDDVIDSLSQIILYLKDNNLLDLIQIDEWAYLQNPYKW